jgi:uncharacterized protein YraI
LKRLALGIVAAGALGTVTGLPTSSLHAHSAVRLQAQYANARQADTTSPTPNDVVALARKYLGSPYATIGNTPSQGFSCIGFVNFVFHQLGVFVPYDIDQAWNSEPHVALTNLMPGDILFYSNTVFAGLSHVAIYIGNDEMIGADNFAVGVTTDRITDPYWTEHYTGATRPLALAGSIPTPVQAGLVIPAPTPTAAPLIATLPVGGTVQPMSNQVAMYSGPGYQYTPMDTLNPSMVLTIVQILGGWYNVHVGTTYGWVSANLVRTVTLTHVPEPREQVPTPFFHASAKKHRRRHATVCSGRAAQHPQWSRQNLQSHRLRPARHASHGAQHHPALGARGHPLRRHLLGGYPIPEQYTAPGEGRQGETGRWDDPAPKPTNAGTGSHSQGCRTGPERAGATR